MRAWRYSLTLLLLALSAALGSRVVPAERSWAADTTATDDGGFNVRVVEEGAAGKAAYAKAREAYAKAREAVERARAAAERAGARDAPEPPAVPEPPAAPEDADLPFDRASANDLVRFGEDIEIPAGKTVEGDVVAIGGDITVYGRVRGDAVAVGGAVRVKGTGAVEGDAVSLGGGVSTTDSASVGGSNVSIGAWDFGRGWKAMPAIGAIGAFGAGMWLISALVELLLTLFFAWIALLLLRDRILRAGEVLAQHFGRSFLLGILAWAGLVLAVPVGIVTLLIVSAVAIVILCITIIGIPLALLLVVALVLAMMGLVVGVLFAAFLGYVNGVMYLGRRVLGTRFGAATKPIVAIVAGLLVVIAIEGIGKLLGTVGIFLVHPLSIAFGIAAKALSIIITTAGLGAFVESRFGTGAAGPRESTYNWGPVGPASAGPPPAATGKATPVPPPIPPEGGGTSDAP
jgi:hypothetical protein